MKKLFLFSLLFIVLFLNNCSKKEVMTSLITEDDIERQMIKAYRDGMQAFKNNQYLEATKILMRQNFYSPNQNGL